MEKNEFTVTQLNEYVNGLMKENAVLSNVTVKGEISNYINHRSGHRYFSLKDKDGLISCAMFSFQGKNLKFEPKNGDKVVATGQVGVYVKSGQYQLYVKSMAQEGIGNLYEKYEKLKRQLQEEGLFDQAAKKPIPMLPRRIGIVTSHQGAAVQDMLNIICRRYDNSDICIYPAKVQGEGAYLTVMEGISYFDQCEDVDVIIIGRGGGSLEDLWAFNEELLARAIFACHTPIISAVGHETDFTIADFVADLRAPTPSAAAELCVPIKLELSSWVESQKALLMRGVLQTVERQRAKADVKKNQLLRFNPINRLLQQRQTVDGVSVSLQNAMTQKLERYRASLERCKAQLVSLNPSGVLKRGYAIVKGADGSVLTSASAVKSGEHISVSVSDGDIAATVD